MLMGKMWVKGGHVRMYKMLTFPGCGKGTLNCVSPYFSRSHRPGQHTRVTCLARRLELHYLLTHIVVHVLLLCSILWLGLYVRGFVCAVRYR